MKKLLSVLLVASMLLSGINVFAARFTDNPMVFVIGDSTAETQPEIASTLTGWGQMLYNFFTDGYMVNNLAISGESSRSYYDKHWKNVISQVKQGDYVLIQFGHNDSKEDGADSENLDISQTTSGRYTNPAGDKNTEGSFAYYLNKYVTEIEAKGATAILVTSIERRPDAYKTAESSQLYPWVKAMKDFASEEGKAIINIWDDFRDKIVFDCPSSSTLHPWFTSYTGLAKTDDTHLTRIGAIETARMVANKLEQSNIALKSYLKASPDNVVYEELEEKFSEDFSSASEGAMYSYNGWKIGGEYSIENTPLAQIVYDDTAKTNKVLNFYRDGSKAPETNESPYYALYTLKNPIGADNPADVEESERYVSFSYKFRSEIHGAGFPITFAGKTIQINPPNSRLFLGSLNTYIGNGAMSNDTWHTFNIYCDLKLKKITVAVNGTRYFTEEAIDTSKIDTIKIQPARCAESNKATNHTWSYKMDDIELSVIDEEAYCEAVGIELNSGKNPTVFVMGDSTAATYSEARAPRTGWGQVLHNFFTDGYMVNNFAQSGASAHSAYDSYWQTMKEQIKPGDYVLIQFGHNDSAKTGYDDEGQIIDSLYRWGDPTLGSNVAPPETLSDNPNDYSYKWYLKQFVDYIEGARAYPIFVTSVERRDHAIERANDADSGLYPWVKAMKELGGELDVPVIDVWTEVRTLIKNMEKENSGSTEDLYMILQPGEYDYYINGINDNTHLSLKGALEVSRIFARLLKNTDIPLKDYLVADIDSVTSNTVLTEKIEEDFYGAPEGIVASYNGWYVKGTTDTVKSPYVKVVYEDEAKTNKAINFYRNEETNPEYDSDVLKAEYILKKPLGADSPEDVKDSERYVRLKYRFRSDLISSSFTVSAGGMQVTVEPSGSYLRVKRDGVINKPVSFGSYKNLELGKWYDIEVYYDLKLQKISTFVDKNRLHTEENFATSKISNVSMSSVRYVSTTKGSWNYFIDDIQLSTIDEDTYCDYVGVLPDETYIMKETFNIYDEGTRITNNWNEWEVGNPSSAVAMIKIAENPKNSSNNVLAFQRTGVPGSPNKMTKTFAKTATDGYVKLSFDLMKTTDTDNLFEVFVYGDDGKYWGNTFDFNTGSITTYKKTATGNTSVIVSFDEVASGYQITKNKWYKFEFVYDLTGNNGRLTAYVNGRKIIDNIESALGTNARTNNGTINKISIGLNRTNGSTLLTASMPGGKENTPYDSNNTLIADVRLDNLELKYAETKPVSLIYSADGAKINGVSIKNERAADTDEKMMVAVYEAVNGETVLKGVSMCDAVVYGKNAISLEKPLSVASGDTVKVFFWDMIKLLPKAFLEAVK